MATRLEARFIETRTPPVEAHRPVVTYLQFPIQVCFPCNDHAQPAADKATIKAPTSVTDNLVKLMVVYMFNFYFLVITCFNLFRISKRSV